MSDLVCARTRSSFGNFAARFNDMFIEVGSLKFIVARCYQLVSNAGPMAAVLRRYYQIGCVWVLRYGGDRPSVAAGRLSGPPPRANEEYAHLDPADYLGSWRMNSSAPAIEEFMSSISLATSSWILL